LRINWGGHQLELQTQLRSGLEVYHRSSDSTTRGLREIPPRTELTVTVWRTREDIDDHPAEPAKEKGWWAEDGGADFESRIDPDDSLARRVLEWARALKDEDLVRVYSYHSANESIFTLLPYLNQHDAGLVTVWGSGRLSLNRTVFSRFAPTSIRPIEDLIGKPMLQRTGVREPDDQLLGALHDAYVAAANVPVGGEWTDERFDATFDQAAGSTALVAHLRAWADRNDVALRYGRGKTTGPMHFDVPTPTGRVTLFSLAATGWIEWVFRDNLENTSGFANRDQRLRVVRAVATLFGVERAQDRADTWFGVNAASLDSSKYSDLTSLLDDTIAVVTAPT